MQKDELLEMTGSVEQIIFRNEKNQYTVLELNNGQELVTVVGTLPGAACGEELRVFGAWENHPSFGQQFKAQAFERTLPSTSEAMLKYLSSGAVKGIGPVLAARLVEAFGEHTFEILEKEPERLCSVKGITKAKARKLAEEFQKVYGIREIMVYLGKFGVTPEEAVRVWKQYGAQAAELVQEDPYCLCTEEVGLDFDRADRIAASLEKPQDARCRVRAGLFYVLRHNAGNGHTCLPADKLIPTAARMLGVPEESAAAVAEEMKQSEELVSCVFQERDYLFTPRLYRAEWYIAARLRMMLRYPAQPILHAEGYVEEIEAKEGIRYARGQKEAILQALSKGMLILTGGPGTGKTTTLNAMITILEQRGERVFLAAPTGRAAKRMSEVTGREAKTVHRLLQVGWTENDQPVFSKNEKNLLECDALIIDELSMVDVSLFEGVLRALPLGCRLILVGDCDQLPSVGPGDVLGDLIASGMLPVVQLREVFRQSMKSLIVSNAHRIVSGELPELSCHDGDFFFLPVRDPEKIRETVVGLCAKRLPASYGYSPFTEIQVLSPGRKGELGTYELNLRLQQALNPPAPGKTEARVNGTLFREGDKVMHIKNNYDLVWSREDGTAGEGVFNGDVGTILAIDRRAAAMTVQIDDKWVLYTFENAAELELAYAMTVHKSQGNEFQAVVIPMYPGPRQLYYRNLLYTAITRARSLLILVGWKETVRQMVENDRKTKRFSGLRYLLAGEDGDSVEGSALAPGGLGLS